MTCFLKDSRYMLESKQILKRSNKLYFLLKNFVFYMSLGEVNTGLLVLRRNFFILFYH